MNLVFIIKNRDNTPFMVVSTTPEGSTFKPMTEAAKEVATFLRQEYGKTPITKPELVQTMDSSKIIEGPSPSGSAIEKKVANLALLKPEIVETKNLPVLSISEVLLSEFSNEEFRNVLSFKASSFISDQTQSSFNFEIKGVRAIWDPSLSIPGTNRRGGFRCPVGTRYGGQITDRFGRSCGWGVARRIANQIADIGERLEQRDDDKRKRRLDRRNARMMRRLGGVPETGRVEGGLRGIADRLEGGAKPKPRRARGGGREFAAEVWNASNVGRVVNAVRGDRNQGDALPEAGAPSARRPQNRRRDVIPETAPTPTPKPAPKPRPARRPAPAGQRRPQPRPRVAPQPANVDVLTAREASDAGATEDFSPYVLRKYNEYAKRVREIRAGGGNAGMLTRREWYAINKPNLRDAWKDAHGRSAPQDFEPPTPQARRPRNNRGRRKKATTAGAARSATRKPAPDDVPEPAPVKPVRPAARNPRLEPTQDFDHTGVAYSRFEDAKEKANRLARLENRQFHVVAYTQNGKSSGRDAYYVLDDDQMMAVRGNQQLQDRRMVREEFGVPAGGLTALRNRINAQLNAPTPPSQGDGSPTPPEPPTPRTPPRAPRVRNAPKNNVVSLDEEAAKRVNDRNVAGIKKSKASRFNKNHGHIEIDGILVPKAVKKGNANISTQAKANQFVKNGGDLDDVPDAFLKDAILANGNYPNEPAGQISKRFKLLADPGNGINNRASRSKKNKTYVVEDAVSGKKYILKSPSFVENEFIGEQYAAVLGQAFGRPMSRVRIAGDMVSIRGHRNITRNAAILVEHYGDVVDGDIKAGRNRPNQIDPVAQGMVRVLDRVMGNPDRHAGNYLWVGNEQIPIDHGIFNNGVGRIRELSKTDAKRMLAVDQFNRQDAPALAQIQDSISKLTVQQIDLIVENMKEAWGSLDAATPADKIKIDASIQAIRVNLKNLKEAADEIRLARP
jgi:hypothetical protein